MEGLVTSGAGPSPSPWVLLLKSEGNPPPPPDHLPVSGGQWPADHSLSEIRKPKATLQTLGQEVFYRLFSPLCRLVRNQGGGAGGGGGRGGELQPPDGPASLLHSSRSRAQDRPPTTPVSFDDQAQGRGHVLSIPHSEKTERGPAMSLHSGAFTDEKSRTQVTCSRSHNTWTQSVFVFTLKLIT